MESIRIDFHTPFDKKNALIFNTHITKAIKAEVKKITLDINSPGGEVDALFSMLTMIEYAKSKGIEIITYCSNLAASCGAILFSVGDKKYIHPSGRIMIHTVMSQIIGRGDDLVKTAKAARKHQKKLNDEIFEIMSKGFKYSKNKMRANCAKEDWWISAGECVELGFAEIAVI